VQDKLEPDPFPFLGLAEKEILKRLALLDGLSEGEELNLLIRARARSFGSLKDLLDERHAKLSQRDVLVVESLTLRKESGEVVGTGEKAPDRPPRK